ncbi:MAG: glycoside hydrolase family 3 N-terminal domain-containing protein [bacterium]
MNRKNMRFKKTLILLSTLTLLFAVIVGWQSRSPLFYWGRPYLSAFLSLLCFFFAVLWFFKRTLYSGKAKRRVTALSFLFVMASGVPVAREMLFSSKKQSVLHADPLQLQKWGRHLMIGFENWEDVEPLVARGALGGLFITRRNVAGFSFEEVKGKIAHLQTLQEAQGLPPLWIATDQEGGLISKLSPLLTPLPPLAKVVRENPEEESLKRAVTRYASLQAEELARLGVNVNFSPVVDLKNPAPVSFPDAHSLIRERAISEDPRVVEEVAALYCETFEKHGVIPTLKHFPGMAGVTTDTHLYEGSLSQSREELESKDWLPFRKTLEESSAFLMLGHVRVPSVDRDYPASLSKKTIQEIVRGEWHHDGILITDDLCMGPTFSWPGGIGASAVTALNAGVDLLLVAYDGEQYYEVMEALLRAEGKGKMDSGLISRSIERLNRVSPLKVSLREQRNMLQ